MPAVRTRSLIAAVCFTALFLMTAALPAQTFQVLHTFKGPDGASPLGSLVLDDAGNIYGTTGSGGSGTHCPDFTFGCGTAFVLNKTGREVGLYSFNGPNGAGPQVGLMRSANGDLYGTADEGGIYNAQVCPAGCGVAFRLDKTGKEIFYRFKGPPDGFYPGSVPVEDSSGNLYGTTSLGGPSPGGLGAVFKIDPRGREKILYSFTGYADGCYAGGGVVLDEGGNLYGVANQGGSDFCEYGFGTVFKLTQSGQFSVIHTFVGGDGAYPGSNLTWDAQGNLYGVTSEGGSSPECFYMGGCGTVFELSPKENGTWTEKVLYSFCSQSGCTDGLEPSGSVSRDASGNLYGTTFFGGTYRNCNGDECGVAFKLAPDGAETVLHDFTGGSDGAFPTGGLVLDAAGSIYGSTEAGGTTCDGSDTCGVVFKIVP